MQNCIAESRDFGKPLNLLDFKPHDWTEDMAPWYDRKIISEKIIKGTKSLFLKATYIRLKEYLKKQR